jgi:thymidylate synthase ThyX
VARAAVDAIEVQSRQMTDEQRRVFSVIGTLPEPGGYAVAKFSRSARPYQDWIRELTQEGASRFYEQFYFAYGHASIADLAHVTMIAENISIVAAVEVLDEQLVDAQESSTRYQDFTRRRYYTPPEIADSAFAPAYRNLCDRLFDVYHEVHHAVVDYYERRYGDQRPGSMADDEYRRTLRARAFDIARYLLPSSTYTGLGYLCSARTLERQVRRLAASPLREIQEVAEALRQAATEPAYNPRAVALEPEIDAFMQRHPGPEAEAFGEQVRNAAMVGAAAAPTLVRYTEASPYANNTCAAAGSMVDGLLDQSQPDGNRGAELAAIAPPPVELAATLAYRASPLSYRQITEQLARCSAADIDALVALAFAERGPHDEPIRETRVGYQLVFDLCLDNGAFRDLHRHRNCVQIIKDFTPRYGYDTPEAVAEGGQTAAYQAVMEEAGELAERLEAERTGLGQYALPLAFRRRALFKMDAAELGYIVETRTRPAGHASYRQIAYDMYQAYGSRYPTLARNIRVTDPKVEEFFER